MKNLKHSHKLIISAVSIVTVIGLMVVALNMQGSVFNVESPKVDVAPVQSEQLETIDQTQNSYNNPLKGIYVNPFAN